MLKISNIKIRPDKLLTKDDIAKASGIPKKDIKIFKPHQRSVDARKKPDVLYNYSVLSQVLIEKKYLKNKNVSLYEYYQYLPPKALVKIKSPLVVGSGPAGLFCAYILANSGLNPILVERGDTAEKRVEAVNNFWENGILSTSTNVQFGEGGAGTFSDGKLTTGVNDKRLDFIKEIFVKYGAPDEILYLKKPHIGTDKLVKTVTNMRKAIEKMGGKVMFNTMLSEILIKDGKIHGAILKDGQKEFTIDTDNIVLAIGHSARDTIRMLYEKNVPMTRKTFSIGARIEHLQDDISLSQYGKNYKLLPPADYKLAEKTSNGRGVYTFCMCPGGYVVASASSENSVVTNGMSYFMRDGKNANSALLVTVNPDDIEGNSVLAGIELQEKIEKTAYDMAGRNYFAPCQLVGDFLKNRISESFGKVKPTYMPGTTFCNIREILPKFICDAMAEVIPIMDKKLKGFASDDAILTVPETRSSSPVQITRDSESLQSKIKGLYPCGEGAGYAGGIMSAALDGIKCAEAIIRNNTFDN